MHTHSCSLTWKGPRCPQTLSERQDLCLSTSCVGDPPALDVRGIQEVGTMIPFRRGENRGSARRSAPHGWPGWSVRGMPGAEASTVPAHHPGRPTRSRRYVSRTQFQMPV